MKIYQQCIIDLIAENGYEHDYLDSFSEGVCVYHFSNKISLTFESSCVSIVVADFFLQQFQLDNKLKHLKSNGECHCDW
ncbi:MAG: hypothetical protein COA32_06840 [Fluviicola sp.]|nr:MAG: hypothetical protein COA32_06840 [Fluviicola sp.]